MLKDKSAKLVETEIHDRIVKKETQIWPMVYLPVGDVNLNDWNPNFVSGRIQSAIKDDINKNGFIDPIVVQKWNKKMKKPFVIINGEHRFKIMQQRNEKQISAIVLDVDDKKAKALTIRLNREHGEMFPDKMSMLLKDLSPKLDFKYLKDITFLDQDEVLAFSEVDVDAINERLKKPKNTKNIFQKEVTCPKCNHVFTLDK